MRLSAFCRQAHFAFYRRFFKNFALFLAKQRALPEERRKIVLMYYFEGLTDVEIGKQLNISRSRVQYRRTSSFEQLKKYLEENADEWIEW